MTKNENVTHLFTHSLINLFTPQNTGLLRRFARNDVKDLVPFHPLSLPSPSRGEGHRKVAFTLAEVLITLGIIGVVAAMTIPNLIAEQQKRTTVTKLQRAMSVLNQAYRRAYDDVGEASTSEANAMGSDEYFKRYWASYLKTAHICKALTDCGYEEDAKFITRNELSTDIISENNRLTLKTFDGFTYVIMTAIGSSTDDSMIQNNWIIADINSGKGPNKYGKDVFVFVRTTDGEKGGVVLPYGASMSNTDINTECAKCGLACAEKIRRAGWKIEKDYPW